MDALCDPLPLSNLIANYSGKYLLLLGFSRWQPYLRRLLKDLLHSDMDPCSDRYFIEEKVF